MAKVSEREGYANPAAEPAICNRCGQPFFGGCSCLPSWMEHPGPPLPPSERCGLPFIQ